MRLTWMTKTKFGTSWLSYKIRKRAGRNESFVPTPFHWYTSYGAPIGRLERGCQNFHGKIWHPWLGRPNNNESLFTSQCAHCLEITHEDCDSKVSQDEICLKSNAAWETIHRVQKTWTAWISDEMLTDFQNLFTPSYFLSYLKHVASVHREVIKRICRKLHCVPIKCNH